MAEHAWGLAARGGSGVALGRVRSRGQRRSGTPSYWGRAVGVWGSGLRSLWRRSGTPSYWGGVGATFGLALMLGGCTGESTRVALESQRRADVVQQAIFERQHDGLRVLLFRDTLRQLDEAGEPLAEEQRMVLNSAWNERDMVEFWALQNERAKALRLIGVDAKLFGDQSVIDLLVKAVERRVDRVEQAVVEATARAAAERATTRPAGVSGLPPGEGARAAAERAGESSGGE